MGLPILHGEAGVNADADAECSVLRRFRRVIASAGVGGGVIIGCTGSLRVGTITALNANDRRVIAKRLQSLSRLRIRLLQQVRQPPARQRLAHRILQGQRTAYIVQQALVASAM